MGNFLSSSLSSSSSNPVLVPPSLEGLLATVENIISDHPNPSQIINNAGPDGSTPIICATFKGSVSVVSLLLANGADPLLKNVGGHNAYWVAAGYNKPEILKLLISDARHPSSKFDLLKNLCDNDKGDSPLLASAFKGNEKILEVVRDALAPGEFEELALSTKNYNGDDLLSVLVSCQHQEFLASLLHSVGVNANALLQKRNKAGLLPIHIAAERGSAEIFKLLLSKMTVEDGFTYMFSFDDGISSSSSSSSSSGGVHDVDVDRKSVNIMQVPA